MPKQDAPAPEPLHLAHSALTGIEPLRVGPEAGGVAGLDHLDEARVEIVADGSVAPAQAPEPLRPIDPKAPNPGPGTKIE